MARRIVWTKKAELIFKFILDFILTEMAQKLIVKK